MGINGEDSPFFLETVTEFREISMYTEGKVIHAPLIVARKIPEGSYTVCPVRILARSPSPDEDGYPFKDNGNLWGATKFIRLGDFATQHVRVPSGSRMWVITDNVDVLKNEASISHNGYPFLTPLPPIQLGSSHAPIRSTWTERVM